MPKEDHVNQHIAPKRYLSRFAEKNGEKYIVGVVLKREHFLTFFKESIDNVGYVKRFYDVTCREDKKYWEKYFAENIDTLYGMPLETIISSINLTKPGKCCLSESQKQTLSTIICSQMLRVPKVINKHIDGAPAFVEEWKSRFIEEAKHFLPKSFVDTIKDIQLDADEIKDKYLSKITDAKTLDLYTDVLLKRIWFVFVNNTDMPYMTCDSPVLQWNLWGNSMNDSDIGIGRQDTALAFALTPTIMILMLPRTESFLGTEAYENIKTVLNHESMKFIHNYNAMQIENCYQHAFMTTGMFEKMQCDKIMI